MSLLVFFWQSGTNAEVNHYFPHGAVSTEGVLYFQTADNSSQLDNATIERLTSAVKARFADPTTLNYAVNVLRLRWLF